MSYLFTWKTDQDQVFDFSWGLFFDQSLHVENWLGRFGAIVSNLFFYWSVGLSSFITIFLFAKLGYLLLVGKSLRGMWAPFQYTLTFVLFFSPLLAFVFHDALFPWGGAFGNYVSSWLSQFVGSIGTALLFVFLSIAFLVWNFHHMTEKSTFSFKWPKWSFSLANAREDTDLSEEGDEDWSVPSEVKSNKDNKQEEKSALIEELDIINKSALEFDIPKASKKTSAKQIQEATLEVVENDPMEVVEKPKEDMPSLSIPHERETPELIVEQENDIHLEPYDPTMALPKYERPKLSLLLDYEEDNVQIDRAELEQNKDQIINTLRHYKIEIERIRATIGPTVTLYEIVPAPGVRISKIKNLEDDIALSLAALGIRIIAPIPGKGTIGIEVPNKNKQTVGLKELLHADKFKHGKMDLPIALGKTISNEVFIADLAKMPHLLIAGATGQGKSVGINTILMSLLYKKHPSQVKLVLIDPKKVELFPYGQLANHFLAFLPDQEEPIITETKKVVNTLNSLCIEMDQRYDLLKKAHARNIQEYNKKFISRHLNPNNGHRFLPFIVLVVDEFADLIMTAGKEVELPIARLAQLARAVGIHLIIATQRPSVNIITGVIKANFPARLAFRVTSKVDSRTILDAGGADQLIGRGDMLLTVGGDMIRLQCAFVDTPEVERVISAIGQQQGFAVPFFLPEYSAEDEGGQNGAFSLSDLDEMFEDAALLVINSQQGSTSMIQRRLKLGYNRAGRIMDQLEAVGVVGPNEGSKAREVLMSSEMEFHQQLEMMRQ
jgi:S-DNA-T family DNA segregation ATPase FtsK/SpoIIIE